MTKDVPDGALVMGVPAEIRRRLNGLAVQTSDPVAVRAERRGNTNREDPLRRQRTSTYIKVPIVVERWDCGRKVG